MIGVASNAVPAKPSPRVATSPVEARLAMDVRRRDYVLVNGRPYTRERLDRGWVLDRFPADLEVARGELARAAPAAVD